MTAEKQAAVAAIEKKADLVAQVADEIWSFAELSLQEEQSADLYCRVLEQEGFKVERGICNIPTAFSASYGSGRPIIGLLAEYDALSGLSQKGGSLTREELVSGGCGHGCGHNLLGAGAMAAALGVKAYLEAAKIPGTVVLYGCPGEEGGAAKAFMARDGLWYGLDAALTWHPDDANEVLTGSSNSCIQTQYHFTGVAAHAAGDPDRGRSALDAVELMNVGCNYMREHMIPDARVHYAVTDTGGDAPNVVQAHAEVIYSVRAPRVDQVCELAERVHNIARGAALMTETKVEIQVVSAYADVLQNKVLDNLVYGHMKEIFPLDYSHEELDYAEKFHAVGDPGDWTLYQTMAAKIMGENGKAFFRGAMADVCVPPLPLKQGSTDVGDVSWNVPSAWFGSACFALGTPAHSWLAVAQGKSSIAHRGMTGAASVLARTALELMERPELVEAAWEEMKEAKKNCEYRCLIPEDVRAGSF